MTKVTNTPSDANRFVNTWKLSPDSGFREFTQSLIFGCVLSIPMLAMGSYLISEGITAKRTAATAIQERFESHTRLVSSPAKEQLDLDKSISGKRLFESNCVACHKADGTGVEGLGRDLTKSWFVATLDDTQFSAFLAKGRSYDDPMNTSKVPMPPKGGHPELTDTDLEHLVIWVRALQDPRRMPPLPASAFAAAPLAPTTDAEKALALAAAGGDAELAEYIAHGTKLFSATCAACHGKEARGLKNLGKDLVTSDFCRKLDDDGLLAFIKRGRDPGDPANTSKISMPPRGGNPALSDDDLLDIISYMRSLQKHAGATQ